MNIEDGNIRSADTQGFHAVVTSVANGFIIEVNGKAFVIQSETSHFVEIENALDVISELYKIYLEKK